MRTMPKNTIIKFSISLRRKYYESITATYNLLYNSLSRYSMIVIFKMIYVLRSLNDFETTYFRHEATKVECVYA